MAKKTIVISVIALIILVGGIGWLFVSGRLAFVDLDNSSASAKAVCDTKTVDTYNDVSDFRVRGDSDEAGIDRDGIASLAANIKTRDGYKNDPTCRTILFWAAVIDDKYDEALEMHSAVKSLHEKRQFADSNLRNNQPLFTYESYINGLTGAPVVDNDETE